MQEINNLIDILAYHFRKEKVDGMTLEEIEEAVHTSSLNSIDRARLKELLSGAIHRGSEILRIIDGGDSSNIQARTAVADLLARNFDPKVLRQEALELLERIEAIYDQLR